MKRIAVAAVLGIVMMASATHAQIYKSTDEQGNVVFSDAPAGAASERVELPRLNTTPPPPSIVPLERSDAAAPEPEEVQVTITSPANETTIPMGGGNFSVSASISPEQSKGQLLQLLMDGTPQGEPQPSGTWALQNVMRGQHDLVVEARDASGKVLARSDPVRVYVLRPSIR